MKIFVRRWAWRCIFFSGFFSRGYLFFIFVYIGVWGRGLGGWRGGFGF